MGLAVWIVGLLALTSPSQAQDAPTTCNPSLQCCRSSLLPGDPGCSGTNGPINIVTGNKYKQQQDLVALPGLMGVEVTRSYNSASAMAQADEGGLLGVGWRLSYEVSVRRGGQRQLELSLADGSRLRLHRGIVNPSYFLASDLGQGRVLETRRADGVLTHEWQKLDGTRWQFDERGRLSVVQAPTGEHTSLAYDAKGRLRQVEDPQGRRLELHTDAKGLLNAIDTPVGRIEYRHDAKGRLIGVAQGKGDEARVLHYHHADARHAWALTGIGLEYQGKREWLESYLYDEAGLAVLSTLGRPAALVRDEKGQVVHPAKLQEGTGIEQVVIDRRRRAKDPVNQVRLYNALGQESLARWSDVAGQRVLTQFTGPGCAACPPSNTRWRYDMAGRLEAVMQLDRQGQAVEVEERTLDLWGRVTAVHRVTMARVGAKDGKNIKHGKEEKDNSVHRQLVASLSYPVPNSEGQGAYATQPTRIAMASVVSGRERVITIERNAHGQPTTVTQSGFSPIDAQGRPEATAISRSTTYRYAQIQGRSVLAQVDGPLPNGPKGTPEDSDITTFEHGGTFVTGMTTPGGRSSKLTHDAAGRVASVTNAEGFGTKFQTDSRGQLVQVQSTGPGWMQPITERFKYDAAGHRVEASRVERDEQQTNAEQSKPQWAQGFDTHGRLAWHASALGIVQQRRYDVESRLMGQGRYTNAHAQSTQYHWADDGSPAAMSDNAGRVVSWLQDDKQRPEGIIDTLGRRHTYAGAAGQAANALAPRVLVDDFGQRVQRVSPDSGVTLWQYTAAGQLQGMRDALGNQASYGYTVDGRIQSQVMLDAATKQSVTTRWHYEGQRLVKLEHPTQSERYAYDSRGLRTARIVTINGSDKQHTAITRYEHDAQGQLIATTLPDGSRLNYQKNGQGQFVAVKRAKVMTPWLQGFETQQVIVKDLQRDMIGLKSQTAGNGVQSRSVRSADGSLARTVHRVPKKAMTAKINDQITDEKPWKEQVSLATFNAMNVMLGVTQAHAATVAPLTASTTTVAPSASPLPLSEPKLPGAWWLASDPQAIIDKRYLWDAVGNLRYVQHSAGEQKTSAYAYDRADRLIVAQSKADEVQASLEAKVRQVNTAGQGSSEAKGGQADATHLERFFYDAQGRRVLAQTAGRTSKTSFDKASHRWIEVGFTKASYDEAGQPQVIGARTYQWDAAGRLIKTTDADEKGSSQTTYAYDYRGLRNTKHASRQGSQQQITHYLHDETRQLQAELNDQGKLTRQYVYLADQPLATIDTPSGQSLSPEHASKLSQVMRDIVTIIAGWVNSKNEQTTWLHLNHLGAPEAATDKAANVVWQASYQSFGKASVQGHVKTSGYTLNIRLPGQYKDEETGLHYNRQRYYDPGKGSYLTPDPSGNPDGNNGYAYVRYNPVKYVDPDGLVLFAFDGTGNSNDAATLGELNSSESNVWQFRQLYESGNARYVTGVGTRHRESETQFGGDVHYSWGNTSTVDMGSNFTGPERIQRMIAYFNAEMDLERDDSRLLEIDIVGFSRGAAQGRHFANLINSNTRNGQYSYDVTVNGVVQRRCQMINFRFMGLWDTVLSTNLSGTGYNMGIVPGFQHVAQAVALNEYRGDTFRRLPGSTGAFPLESIMDGAAPFGQQRIERGFIGAHADIGGGFSAGDDSAMARVAMAWMVEQARDAGVQMIDPRADVPASVVIHDKSDNQYCTGGPGCSEDRMITGGTGGTQRRMTGTVMTYADTGQFVTYTPPSIYADGSVRREPGAGFVTGSVDMAGYLAWLRSNGYNLGNLQAQ